MGVESRNESADHFLGWVFLEPSMCLGVAFGRILHSPGVIGGHLRRSLLVEGLDLIDLARESGQVLVEAVPLHGISPIRPSGMDLLVSERTPVGNIWVPAIVPLKKVRLLRQGACMMLAYLPSHMVGCVPNVRLVRGA